MKAIAATAAGVALLVGVFLASIFIVGTLQKGTADFRGGVAATESVKANGAYRIAAYEKFYDQCAAVQGFETTIEALENELPTATPERQAIIQSTLTGLQSARGNAIFQYNADARKTDTQANFKSSTLPFQLDPNQEKTTCVV